MATSSVPSASTFTVKTSGQATIATCDGTTNFDTVLYIREADCSTGTEVDCNDDFCSGIALHCEDSCLHTTAVLWTEHVGPPPNEPSPFVRGAQRTLAAGDMFTFGDATPQLIDYSGGGSAKEWTKTLDGALQLDFDTVVPGHGVVTTKREMAKFRDVFWKAYKG